MRYGAPASPDARAVSSYDKMMIAAEGGMSLRTFRDKHVKLDGPAARTFRDLMTAVMTRGFAARG